MEAKIIMEILKVLSAFAVILLVIYLVKDYIRTHSRDGSIKSCYYNSQYSQNKLKRRR
jgi:hypothetical protein